MANLRPDSEFATYYVTWGKAFYRGGVMPEQRKQLSTKQFQIFIGVRDRVVLARQQVQFAEQELNSVVGLLRDVHGIAEGTQLSIDDVTKELVIAVPDPAPAPAAT